MGLANSLREAGRPKSPQRKPRREADRHRGPPHVLQATRRPSEVGYNAHREPALEHFLAPHGANGRDGPR